MSSTAKRLDAVVTIYLAKIIVALLFKRLFSLDAQFSIQTYFLAVCEICILRQRFPMFINRIVG